MNVHSLSTVTFAPPRDLIAPAYHKRNSVVRYGPAGHAEPSEGGWAVSSILSDRPAAFAWLWLAKQPVATTAAETFLRFRIDHCFHGVMRHNGHRLLWRHSITEWGWGRLRDELADRGDHAQNAGGINRRFHYAPAFLLRVYQEPVDRLSFVVHNFKTPRSSRFV